MDKIKRNWVHWKNHLFNSVHEQAIPLPGNAGAWLYWHVSEVFVPYIKMQKQWKDKIDKGYLLTENDNGVDLFLDTKSTEHGIKIKLTINLKLYLN